MLSRSLPLWFPPISLPLPLPSSSTPASPSYLCSAPSIYLICVPLHSPQPSSPHPQRVDNVYTLPSTNDVYEFARELFLKAQVRDKFLTHLR